VKRPALENMPRLLGSLESKTNAIVKKLALFYFSGETYVLILLILQVFS